MLIKCLVMACSSSVIMAVVVAMTGGCGGGGFFTRLDTCSVPYPPLLPYSLSSSSSDDMVVVEVRRFEPMSMGVCGDL